MITAILSSMIAILCITSTILFSFLLLVIFTVLSSCPGLGYDYYTSHKEQMYADDGLYFNGKKRPIPRYFDKKYEEENPKSLWSIKEKRQSSAINALKLKMSNTGLTIEQEAKVEEETKKRRFRKARGLL